MRVGIYLRVSTLDQSTELQRREIEQYLSARAWLDCVFYEDRLTGTNGNRPQLIRLIKDAKERKIDVVICWKLDRLFRSLKNLISTLQDFTEVGVSFISLKDNIDLTTSSGRLMMHMLGAFAEFEAALIRERVRAGLNNAKKKGKTLGRPPSIDLNQVLQLRAQKKSLAEIARAVGATKGGVSKSLKKTSLAVRHKGEG